MTWGWTGSNPVGLTRQRRTPHHGRAMEHYERTRTMPDTPRSTWRVRRQQQKLRRKFRRQNAAKRFAIRGTWGFACHVWCHEQDPTGQTAKAYGFGHYPKVGDVIQEGDRYWWVTATERCRDPRDMWTGRVLIEPDPSRLPGEPVPESHDGNRVVLL